VWGCQGGCQGDVKLAVTNLVVRVLSGYCQGVVRVLSGCCQGVVRVLSG